MSHLSIMLKLDTKRAAVIGGGSVAARHIPKLLELGIKEVNLYAPTIDSKLEQFIENPQFHWVKGSVESHAYFDEELLFFLTNNPELHLALFEKKKPYQLVYFADDSSLSDFHFPLTVQRGSLSVSLSTGGASPTYGKKLMKKVEGILPETIEDDLLFLEKARKQVLNSQLDQLKRREILRSCASASFLQSSNREELLQKLINKANKK
ncbi:hypothetical protein JCM9140_784 [Halalkalibacter wakoensis JCM 9140]|uniref:precorrin-2 dehydrogenase n=1 Tax=Halalkalibacter wakoensis JCM 9140 TaxID=1236970 RepID=W4PYB6_9BACI|nr:bifunctional precorrin-2 dehydrogenase/sirohydrochlorin ferrochelatase [Halalkalibacter wakoensis]GAE24831.1 hypothetical protein JCM9140_784 [Halalkalibacter wakoensis JCM 9140]